MYIKDFKETIKRAHANALRDNKDRFVTIGTDFHTYCEKSPTTSCWRVTPEGEIWKQEYLPLGEGKGLKMIAETRDPETERILLPQPTK
jgi:hypothetical protein